MAFGVQGLGLKAEWLRLYSYNHGDPRALVNEVIEKQAIEKSQFLERLLQCLCKPFENSYVAESYGECEAFAVLMTTEAALSVAGNEGRLQVYSGRLSLSCGPLLLGRSTRNGLQNTRKLMKTCNQNPAQSYITFISLRGKLSLCDRQHEVQKSGAGQSGSNKSSKAKQKTNGVHDEDHDQRVLSRIANVSTRFSNNL